MLRSTRLAALIILLAAGASGAQVEGTAPPDTVEPQTVVPRLANFTSLSTIMNLARGAVRIVAIVSPSSPEAAASMDAIASVLGDIPSKRLRAYVILSQAREDDSRVRALDLAARHRDRRIVYLWDPGTAVAAAMAPLTGSSDGTVHGVFFLYDTDATFTTVPPAPVLWMQLGANVDGPALDAESLRDRADELVKTVERKAATAAPRSD